VLEEFSLPWITGYKPTRKGRWVSVEEGDRTGYDIWSFELSGAEKLIEVKPPIVRLERRSS
jgi:hypothetical protein